MHYTIKKLGVSIQYIYIQFKKHFCKGITEINTFILQGCFKLIKRDDKTLQKVSISDKCCSSELSIHQSNLKKRNSAVFNIIIKVF